MFPQPAVRVQVNKFRLDREEMVCDRQIKSLVEVHFPINALFCLYDPGLEREPDEKIALVREIGNSAHFYLDLAPRVSVGAIGLQVGQRCELSNLLVQFLKYLQGLAVMI
jgi:hypothetical protein